MTNPADAERAAVPISASAPVAGWIPWDGVLPTRRPPVVLSLVLFATMLAQSMLDPLAFLIDGSRPWANPIPFGYSVMLLVALCTAQAATLLLTTRWPVLAVVGAMVVSLTGLFLLGAPSWTSPLQLAVIAALFLLSTRRSAAVSLMLLAALVLTQIAGLSGWSSVYGLSAGTAVGFVLAQSAGSAAAFAAAVALGLWWGAETRRVARMRAQAEEERRTQEERLTRAREAERARIAQELHDVAAQHVAGLLSLTEAALTVADTSSDALTLLTEARAEARFAAASLYSALNELRATGQARAETTPDLHNLDELTTFWRRRDLRVHMRTSPRVDSLPAVVSATAYRIAQESLTNVAKHAPGTSADLSLRITDDTLDIEIVNGPSPRGLPDTHAIGLGWGLNGIRERVTLLGGQLVAGPTDLGGWRVQATIPLTDAARDSVVWSAP